jgi:hypothetical protein
VADHYGLTVVLWISALLPVAGFLAALFLPSPDGEAAWLIPKKRGTGAAGSRP